MRCYRQDNWEVVEIKAEDLMDYTLETYDRLWQPVAKLLRTCLEHECAIEPYKLTFVHRFRMK